MLRLRWVGFAGLLVVGCGPEVHETAELRELCGHEAPVQLLALSDLERVPVTGLSVVPHGDRYLIGVQTYDSPPSSPLAVNDVPVASRLVSVDRCGDGEPVEVAVGFSHVYAPLEDGDPWLGFEGERVFEFDPDGAHEPATVCEECGVVSHDGRRYIYTRGEAERTFSLRELGSTDPFIVEAWVPQWVGERIYYAAEGQLWSHAFDTGDRELVFDDVGVFSVAEGATVFATSPGTDLAEENAWTFRDADGLALAGPFTGSLYRSDNVFRVAADGRPTIVFDATSRTEHSIDERWKVRGRIDDGRLLVFDWDTHEVGWWSPATGEVQVSIVADLVEAQTRGADVLIWDYGPRDPGEPRPHQTTRLLRVPSDGSPPEVVLDDVHQPFELDDGRWVTARNLQTDDTGDLWVIDPETNDAALIQRDVDMYLTRFLRSAHVYPGEAPYPADAPFFYTRRKAGEDTGLWMVALGEP